MILRESGLNSSKYTRGGPWAAPVLRDRWSIATGFVRGVGLTLASALDAVVLVTCIALARSKSRAFHVAGLTLVWIAYSVGAVLDIGG